MIDAISAISAGSSVAPTSYVDSVADATDTNGVFASALASAIDSNQAAQSVSSELAVKAVTGTLDDVHDYTIAATEASTQLQLIAAVRDKAVSAFQEIMRMQA